MTSEKLFEYAKSPCKGKMINQQEISSILDEPHVSVWAEYLQKDFSNDWTKLQQSIPQFNIPIRTGISKTDAYVSVVKRGETFSLEVFGEHFLLKKPEQFRCIIYKHPAGSLPVLMTTHREDFENLFRLCGCQCEPIPVNPSVNALMISGFTNWQRIFDYRTNWLKRNNSLLHFHWNNEMQRVAKEEPQNFKDRFIIVMQAPYSGVDWKNVGIEFATEENWLEKSLTIRLEHEFTHYALKRFFDIMRKHVWDEVIADFMGITLALNSFKADLFYKFLGLDKNGVILPSARITHYIDTLPPEFTETLCKLLINVGLGLEHYFSKIPPNQNRMNVLLDLSQLSLFEMAEQ